MKLRERQNTFSTYVRITLLRQPAKLASCSLPQGVISCAHAKPRRHARAFTALRRLKSNLYVKRFSSRSAKGKRGEEEKREMRRVDDPAPIPLPLSEFTLFEFLLDLTGYCQTL